MLDLTIPPRFALPVVDHGLGARDGRYSVRIRNLELRSEDRERLRAIIAGIATHASHTGEVAA